MPEIMRLDAYPLEGRFVRLEPYRPALKDEMQRALDCDVESWSILGVVGYGEYFEGWWASSMEEMARGQRIPYVVRRISDAKVVGTSAYLNIEAKHFGVEIGATFLRPEARAGVVNPDMKRLMLATAFKAGAMRVAIVTDARNLRSQAAIAKLGAVKEGTLRKHRLTFNGWKRDTVVFSILDDEWPDVRNGLDARLDASSQSQAVPA